MAWTFASGPPYLSLGSLAALSGVPAMAITAWVKFAAVDADAVIALRGAVSSVTAPWMLWRDEVAGLSGRSNTLAALVNTDVGLLRVEGVSELLGDVDNWHHVALVFEAGDAAGLRLYVDGVRDPNTASTVGHTAVVADTSGVTVGMNDATRQLLADVAELAFWTDALTDNEVAQLANGFTPLTLASAMDRLAAYHDLLRPLNRPGVGPAASAVGTFGVAPHPPTIPPGSMLRCVATNRSLLDGPYRPVSSELVNGGSEAGELTIAGAADGALIPSGEVNS